MTGTDEPLRAAAALLALILPLACRSAAPTTPVATPRATPAAPSGVDPLLAASAAAFAGELALAYDGSATIQLQIENRLTRVTGRVELAARDGALLAARIDAQVNPPAPQAAGRVVLDWSNGRWLALDHAQRSACVSPDPAQLPARARDALALLPRDFCAPRAWIPAGAGASAGERTDFAEQECASVAWRGLHASGELLIARDGVPRLVVETRETPGVEVEVRRVVLQGLARRAPPAAPLVPPPGWSELAPQAPPAPRPVPEPGPLVSLAESFEPLRAAFDAAAGKPRVIATFSPTCLNCLRLARSARESILDAHPGADVAFFAVWVDVLDGDSPATARDASLYVADPRAVQFHDSERRFARLLARQVGMPALRDLLASWGSSVDEQDRVFVRDFVTGEAAAYDWIVFHGPEARWTELDALPQAASAVVQMSPDAWRGIDPAKFFWGPAMAAELRRLADLYFVD